MEFFILYYYYTYCFNTFCLLFHISKPILKGSNLGCPWVTKVAFRRKFEKIHLANLDLKMLLLGVIGDGVNEADVKNGGCHTKMWSFGSTIFLRPLRRLFFGLESLLDLFEMGEANSFVLALVSRNGAEHLCLLYPGSNGPA